MLRESRRGTALSARLQDAGARARQGHHRAHPEHDAARAGRAVAVRSEGRPERPGGSSRLPAVCRMLHACSALGQRGCLECFFGRFPFQNFGVLGVFRVSCDRDGEGRRFVFEYI